MRFSLVLSFAALAACAVEHGGLVGTEADSGEADAPDLGTDLGSDLGVPDGPSLDMGVPDVSPPDMGPPDMGPPDMSPDMPADMGPDMPVDMGMPDTCVASAEVCDNRDNDCDGMVDNGLTRACGDEPSPCTPGTQTCTAGAWGECTGGVRPSAEVCDDVDNDCDGEVDDGLATMTYYGDTDMDGFGDRSATTMVCGGAPAGFVANSQDCNDRNEDINPDATEECDGVDNDCDGDRDELAPSGTGNLCQVCTRAERGGHGYLVCSVSIGGSTPNWRNARDLCRAAGYELTTIDDEAEHDFVRGLVDARVTAGTAASGEWWIGLNDIDDDAVEVWVADGEAATYRDPITQDGGSSQNCFVFRGNISVRRWSDRDCDNRYPRFICETTE